ncbi:MAG: hypothetical protein K0B37_14830 [Bacteroidales bacterium]|nr:hypothetical protein [Bacteroidales bacterium]
MEFILGPVKPNNSWKSITTGNYFLSYNLNSSIKERELVSENVDYCLLGDVNVAFANLVQAEHQLSRVLKHIEKLTNGYLLFINKRENSITLFTDIFGYYHIFSLQKGKEIYVSSDFKHLLDISDKKVDDYALLDLVLFNYTLLDRTLISDIKRLKGGTELVAGPEGFAMNVKYNFAENFVFSTESRSLKPAELGDILVDNLAQGISREHDIWLTMTGGFDSRALLAACNRLELNFSSFTFGQEGNIEMETPKSFINKYTKEHKNYFLDDSYLKRLPEIVGAFIDANLDNPTMLDIVQYSFIKEQSKPSNVIVGFMGGELMAGQSIGSQVTFTAFAAKLITSYSKDELKIAFEAETELMGILNQEHLAKLTDGYIDTLSTYLHEHQNMNLLRFLINEKYIKFFGAINKVFKHHSNLVIPFMNADYIRSLLYADISFLRKKPFHQNPLQNFGYKSFYARMVKYLSPELGETKLDRLYKINDLCNPYRLPIAAAGYIKSHLFKLNKNKFPRPHHYDLWFREIIIDELKESHPGLPDQDLILPQALNPDLYDQYSSLDKKRLANAVSGLLAIKKIQN